MIKEVKHANEQQYIILGCCLFPGHYFFHDHDDYDIKVYV